MLRKAAITVAAASLMHGTVLQAAVTEQCVPPEKAEALITYILPAALTAVGSKCSDSLPETAPLLQTNSSRFEQLSIDSEAAWPEARDVIGLMAGQKFPEGMDMDVMRPMVDAMIPAMLTQEFKTKDCPTIDRVYGLLEPLPSANIAGLTILLAGLGKEDGKKDPFNICKMPEE